MNILENYNIIKDQVIEIAESAGRNPDDITIISVSKTFPGEVLQEAIDSGITILGENKIQEAKVKIPTLTGNFTIHMVGHLQSNKAKEAVKLFDLIHSIDKVNTAQKINTEAEKIGKIQKILIQINTSGEASKNGISPDETINFIRELTDLNNIEVIGLMTMAPYTSDEEIIRRTFRNTQELLEKINSELDLNIKELSMGMSSDYKIAIEEGSTMIRIGTAIFGQRDYT